MGTAQRKQLKVSKKKTEPTELKTRKRLTRGRPSEKFLVHIVKCGKRF